MKTILKIGIILIILGAVSMTVFGLLAKPYLEEQLDYTDMAYDYEGNLFTTIELSFYNNPVIIKQSLDSQIHIDFKMDQYEEVVVSEENNTLSIIVTSDWWAQLRNPLNWFNFSNFGDMRTVTVELPSQLYTIEIKTSNGAISIDELGLESAILSTSNGRVDVRDSNIPTLRLSSSNGKLYLNNVTSDTIDLSTSNGEIELINVTAEAIDGETSNGPINATGIESNDFRVSTSNGRIELSINGLFADYKVKTRTSNGSVKINGDSYGNDTYHESKVPYVEAVTSNGDIRIIFED